VGHIEGSGTTREGVWGKANQGEKKRSFHCTIRKFQTRESSTDKGGENQGHDDISRESQGSRKVGEGGGGKK